MADAFMMSHAAPIKDEDNRDELQFEDNAHFQAYLRSFFKVHGYGITTDDQMKGYARADTQTWKKLYRQAAYNFKADSDNDYGTLDYNPWKNDDEHNAGIAGFVKANKRAPSNEQEYNTWYYPNVKYKGQYGNTAEDLDAYNKGLAPMKVQYGQKLIDQYNALADSAKAGTMNYGTAQKLAPDLYKLHQYAQTQGQQDIAGGKTAAELNPWEGTKQTTDNSWLDKDLLKQLGYDEKTGFSKIFDWLNQTEAHALRPDKAPTLGDSLPRAASALSAGPLTNAKTFQVPQGQNPVDAALMLGMPQPQKKPESVAAGDFYSSDVAKAYGVTPRNAPAQTASAQKELTPDEQMAAKLGIPLNQYLTGKAYGAYPSGNSTPVNSSPEHEQLHDIGIGIRIPEAIPDEVIKALRFTTNLAKQPYNVTFGTVQALIQNGIDALDASTDNDPNTNPQWQGNLTFEGWKNLPGEKFAEKAFQTWQDKIDAGDYLITGDKAKEQAMLDSVKGSPAAKFILDAVFNGATDPASWIGPGGVAKGVKVAKGLKAGDTLTDAWRATSPYMDDAARLTTKMDDAPRLATHTDDLTAAKPLGQLDNAATVKPQTIKPVNLVKEKYITNAAGDIVPVRDAKPLVKATAADPFVDGLNNGMRELDGGKSIAPCTAVSPAAAAKNTDSFVGALDTIIPTRQPVIKPADLVKAKYTRNAAGEIVPVEAGSQPSKHTLVQEKDGFTAGLDEGMKDLPEVKEAGPEGIDFTKEGGKVESEGEYIPSAEATGTDAAGNSGGPVEVMPPRNATPEQIAQVKAYIAGSNQALQAGALSPTGRVSTTGSLRIRASAAVAKERARATAAGIPYNGHAGHVPDTTWTGSANPYSWLDLDSTVNTSIGGQANRYPIGYRPTEFIYKERQ